MTKSKQYTVNFQKALEYLRGNLDGTNALSTSILAQVDFERGEFYTILPLNVDRAKIDFPEFGGVGSRLREEIGSIVSGECIQEPSLVCVFDNTKVDYMNGYNQELFNLCGRHYGKEVYYVVPHELASHELLDRCFRASNIIWHSLCVLTKSQSVGVTKGSLTQENIRDICSKIELIIVGAYDAEGYIFWKKSK